MEIYSCTAHLTEDDSVDRLPPEAVELHQISIPPWFLDLCRS